MYYIHMGTCEGVLLARGVQISLNTFWLSELSSPAVKRCISHAYGTCQVVLSALVVQHFHGAFWLSFGEVPLSQTG